MNKDKVGLKERIVHWFTYHPWLKVISFALAVAVWFYVRDELRRFYY